ncbi:MAG: hemolysin III family protein, partial [Proteobacteria bacterium]|nr:hemolysin III family protein [Pseudomonadota bacterium]
MNIKIVDGIKYYSPLEEKINIYSHGLGVILSMVALVLLVYKASIYGNVWHIVSFSVFGVSLLVLYTASTLYHGTQQIESRRRLKVFDHATIYVLIAGTYTPFTLVSMHGQTGWIFFGISWGIALIGIILKLFFTGR